MRSSRVRSALLVALFAAAPVLAGDTLETAEKQIVEKNEKFKTLSAKMTTTFDVDGPMGKMSGKAEGTLEYAKHADKMKCRLETRVNIQQGGEGGMAMEQSVLMVCDGEFVYQLSEMMGMKQAVKLKPDAAQLDFAARMILDKLKKEADLKLLADEVVDGAQTFTIEATLKTPKPQIPITKQTLYFSKENGVLLKEVDQDKDGKPLQTTTFSEIKLDSDIKPDRFEFKAPEGVTVVDMTAQSTPSPSP